MNKIYLLTLASLFVTLGIYAQPKSLFQSSPSGYTYRVDVDKQQSLSVKGPEESTIQDIITGKHPKSGDMYVIGQNMPVSLNMQNSGTWQSYSGFKTWRLKIKSEGAQALALLYSSFQIPASAAVFVYNSKYTHKSRPYTRDENPGGAHFSTEVILGDEIVLEYWAPETEAEQARIEIEALSYVFRSGNEFKPKNWNENGNSESCQVNVNCSEGNNWKDQKRGVAKIYVVEGSNIGLCSGSLINNTAQDCKNYFLTAQHCGGGASAANFNQWQFYFNFESSNCNNLSNSQANNADNQTVIGCTRRASSGSTSAVQNSDFLLVEFNSSIPASYNVFYNGWDRSGINALSGTGIHHPAGDIKKISTYSTPLLSTNWTGTPSGSHWQVSWGSTTNGHGVTEGGSSGSPLFNQSKRIVGDLSGGTSYCTSPTSPDLYGKLSYSWQTVGTSSSQRLAPWLDPNSTGATTLDGKNACGGGTPPTGGCDTVSHYISGTHTASILPVPGGTGWMAGTNSYNDKAKAEFFANTFPANSRLNGFYLYFHTATGSGNVTVKVWDATGSGGSPGTILAQGDIAISTIPSNGDPIYLNLTGTPINANNGFYVGIDIPPSGNEVGLYTTAANEVATNTAWEQYNNNTWHSYQESYGNRYAHIIYVNVCQNMSITEQASTVSQLQLFPNPAMDHVYFQLPKISTEKVSIRVVDMAGRTVANLQQAAGSELYKVDVSSWSAGIYQLQVVSGQHIYAGKFLKQ